MELVKRIPTGFPTGTPLEEALPPPRTVKPRIPKHDSRHLLVFDGERVLVERTMEVHSREWFPAILRTEEPAIVICENAPHMLAYLNHTHCALLPGWQYKVAILVRTRQIGRKQIEPRQYRHLMVSLFGWRTPRDRSRNSKSYKTHYHYPIDPSVMIGCAIGKLIPHKQDSEETLAALLAWGIDLRDWCRENGLRMSATTGSLATQLLTDPRFYPEARRKIPHATNEKARPHLPGNHYELHTSPRIFHDAYYLDMKSAHHYCASKVNLPHSDGLRARGKFRKPVGDSEDVPFTGDRPLWPVNAPGYQELIKGHGLLQVQVDCLRPHEKFTLPFLRKPGLRIAWIFTNELELIGELGGQIRGIEAAWISFKLDDGIRKYAEWAMAENRAMSPERKEWCKPVLLSSYGMLAHRPTKSTIGYNQSDKGTRQPVPVPGGGVLEMNICTSPKATESRIANVIQRGMIEAEVRVRVIRMARELAATGADVLALYADSVIVNSDLPLTFLPEPWEIKTGLTNLEFFDPVSFHSNELTKLPGIPNKDDELRISHAKRIAALAGRTGKG